MTGVASMERRLAGEALRLILLHCRRSHLAIPHFCTCVCTLIRKYIIVPCNLQRGLIRGSRLEAPQPRADVQPVAVVEGERGIREDISGVTRWS